MFQLQVTKLTIKSKTIYIIYIRQQYLQKLRNKCLLELTLYRRTIDFN